MGAIKADKLANGNVGLTITYGGKDAPFGGIDSSMPPRYIEPNCFVDSQGFLISAGQLVACGWKQSGINLLDYNEGNNHFLGIGNYYANKKYYNWALAYQNIYTPGSPGNTTVTYFLWIWEAGTTGDIPLTAQLAVTSFDTSTAGTPAKAQIGVYGPPTVAVDDGEIDIYVNGQKAVCAVSLGNTIDDVTDAIVTAINTTPATSALVTAVAGPTTGKVILTTNAIGGDKNSYTLDVATFVRPNIQHVNIDQIFTGGTDAGAGIKFGAPIDPLSWTTIGETLYFGGPGTHILYYNNPDGITPTFNVLTQYLGAKTLHKFNSQLLAAGVVPGIGLNVTDPEMIIAWSAPEGQYSTWSPLDTDGNVTGAGFNEEADISDYITGMFITPGAATLLRTQGIDYLTALQNGVSPFDFQHISNSKRGEGCQDSRLWTQYDLVGIFIGNSDVFVFDGKLTPVGDKIKNLVLNDTSVAKSKASDSCALFLEDEVNVHAFFLIDNQIYVFNLGNKTWMSFIFIQEIFLKFNAYFLGVFADIAVDNAGAEFFNTFTPYIVTMFVTGVNTAKPQFWGFIPTVQANEPKLTPLNTSWVVFPEEEVDFGKDITVDAMLVSVSGVAGQEINFTLTGTGYSGNDPITVQAHVTLTLPVTANTDTFKDYKLYFDEEIFTARNPQLRIDVPVSPEATYNALAFQKITMFGSYDPNQRPV